MSKAVPAIALDEQKVARLVFVGRSNAMFLVAVSEGETYRGGLILTEIGFVGAQSKTLGLWTRVFRAPTAWSTHRDSMRATKVLRDVIAFELSYYGWWDATSPPTWRNEWIGSGRLPALVSIRITFVRDNRRHTAETTVALRQSWLFEPGMSGSSMFFGFHFEGRRPGVRGRFLRHLSIFLEKDGSLIDVEAKSAANDYEGGNFFGGLDKRI